MLELDEYLERKPGQLSGGQRQRVAMGRAIIREPRVFLMDEPLSNLDAKLRVQMRADIAALQSRLGVTTVYVTHDQAEAMTLGHRVAVLRDGRLQQCDTPRALYDRPANTFVAGFIGSPSMNLLERAARGRRVLVRRGRHRAPRRRCERRTRASIVGLRPEALELARDGHRRPRRGDGGDRRRRVRLLRGRLPRRAGQARRADRVATGTGAGEHGSRCARASTRRTCSTPRPATGSSLCRIEPRRRHARGRRRSRPARGQPRPLAGALRRASASPTVRT